MSETTAGKNLPMAEPLNKYNRREFFRKARKVAKAVAFVGVTGTTAGVAGYAGLSKAGELIGERVTQESREKYSQILDKATTIASGDIMVTEGGIIRNESNFGQNLEDRGSIIGINGIPIDGKKAFKLANLPEVEGGDPEGRPGRGNWLAALATMKNPFAIWDEVVYLPTGTEAERSGIIPDRDHGTRFYPIRSKNNDSFILDNGTKDGLKIPRNQIGLAQQIPSK